MGHTSAAAAVVLIDRENDRVRVLFAPDCFTGTLTAGAAAAAMAAGWSAHAPGDEVAVCPLADGGPGFVAVLAQALGAAGGSQVAVPLRGPLDADAQGTVLLVTDANDADAAVAPRTAYLETAQAWGLHLVPPERRDPGRTTTAGVADLMLAARRSGATRIVLGLGGSGTNDGGAGLIAGLAADAGLGDAAVLARLRAGGAALAGIAASDLLWLPELCRHWQGIDLVAATDVEVALLGLRGASAGFAAQKGAGPEQAQRLERCLADWAAAVATVFGRPTGGAEALSNAPGAGAAGGLGFALLALGGRRIGGAEAVFDALGLDRRIAAADLVVTGEGRLDWQSLHGKVTGQVATRALDAGVPVIAIAGQVTLGRREAQQAGFAACYAVAERPAEVAAALADPVVTLQERSRRVARTWSPPARAALT